ncbi:MBL fold metallo-hydrolase [Microbulbifer sp. SAOS-129_SWC]|uniref:MBL fold metallo-hydrolase n=1 Tax=Microbulbifer sp. SAOS-129_SWC TaxID=3145235 RepID=UPI0032178A6D
MEYIPLKILVGKATITRVEETKFSLPPDTLFPDWDTRYGQSMGGILNPASLDLVNQRVPLQTHLWVMEIGGLTIVIDTGIGNGKARPFSKLFDMLDTPLLKRFEEAGFQREQVDYVLLTHLHVDHVGWNTHWEDGRWTPVFPNATYVFSKQECDFFSTPGGAARRMVFEDSVLPIIEAGMARMVPDEGEEILDGIRFLPTPGHSTGHMVISIDSHGETGVFSGDVMHSPLQVYRPTWNSVFCLDQKSAQKSREWLLAYAANKNAIVFSAHFPETSAGRIQQDGNGYEWFYVPA